MSNISLSATLDGSTQDIFVTRGWLRMRDRGPWTAYLESSNTVAPAPGSPVTVLFTRTTGVVDTFNGTVRRAKVNPGNGRLSVSIVGGGGKLITALPPLDHVYGGSTVPAGVVARAICDDAGEQLAAGVEQALDATLLPRWHRASDITGAVALDLLADYLGVPWRVLPSGLITMGAETWQPNDNAAYWQDLDEDDGGVFYSCDGAPLLVGQSVDGAQAIDVRYDFDENEVRCEIRGAVAGDPPHVPDLDLYRGSWPATVKAQNADGTIDVTCDDARLGDLRSLQVRCGLPGASVTLDMTVTNRVRVRFAGASPAGAFAEGFDQGPGAASVLLDASTSITLGTGGAPLPLLVAGSVAWFTQAQAFMVLVAANLSAAAGQAPSAPLPTVAGKAKAST